MSKFEKVAHFILEESDRPISEIVWLLEIAYNNDVNPRLTFKQAWGDAINLNNKESK